MFAQAKPRPSARQVSRVSTIPAPTGGLNAVSALAAMPPTDAIVMNNWFPQPTFVTLRNGYSQWSTGYPAAVETVLAYSGSAGTKLFGISGTAVYDATAGGAIGGSVVSSLTNARWEYTNVATAGGEFLYAANAVDKPLLYSGSTWTKIDSGSSPAITGVTTTTLRNPIVWKNRVWFVQDGTLSAWYLPTASVGGAASQFDFTGIFQLGGTLQAIMTASLTDGSTFDNYIFFMTSEGEIAMYAGVDPAQAGLFVIQGIYRVAPPIGRRCWFKYGQDTIVITTAGFMSLTKMIAIGRVNDTEAISYKIMNSVSDAIQAYGTNYGWQGILHPFGNKIIINVPTATDSTATQFVENTINNSWCTFSNWNAICFEVQGNNLYFGGASYIALADVGTSDNGAVIPATLKTAFNYFGNTGQKLIKMCRPLFQTNGSVTAALSINMDYNDVPPIGYGTSIVSAGAPWNTSSWNVTSWTSGPSMNLNWASAFGIGFTAALYVQISAMGITINLQAVDYVWEPGGVL